jgi:hypothetical protein
VACQRDLGKRRNIPPGETATTNSTHNIVPAKTGTQPPSLRANGSRECAPDDRLREAIHFFRQD